MKPSVAQYAQVLFDLSRESGANASAMAERFFSELRRRKETKKIPQIIEQVERLEEVARGETRVRVLTREALSRQELELVSREAERLFGASKVNLEPEVSEGILGGIILETDTDRVDASVRGKLQQLKKVLK